MFRWIGRKYKQIKSIISIIPILFNDHDWDGVYLVYIMLWKLKRMQKFWSNPKNYHIVGGPKIYAQISHTIWELEQYISDSPSPKYKFTDMEPPEHEFNFPRTEQIQKEFERWAKLTEYDYQIKEEFKRNAFERISKKINKWWD